jgi:periplasmic protein CpxP/Spy
MTSISKPSRGASLKAKIKPLLLASLIAGAAFSVLAQTPPPGPMGGPGSEQRGMMRHGPMDPAKMQAMVAQRQAALKERLKITTAQEGAWAAFTSSMQPPADMQKRRMEVRAEMDKLTTPERIDRMRALRTQRDAEMDKRANAVKTFYAALSPEQQKVFDAQRMRGGDGQGRGHGRWHG